MTALKRLSDHDRLRWSDFGDRFTLAVCIVILAGAVAELIGRTI